MLWDSEKARSKTILQKRIYYTIMLQQYDGQHFKNILYETVQNYIYHFFKIDKKMLHNISQELQ